MPTFLEPRPIEPVHTAPNALIQVFTSRAKKRALQQLALDENTSMAAIVRELIEKRLKEKE